MLKDKNILYIVHNYNSFQKDQIEACAKYFKKVYVLVRYKPISRIAKYLPIFWLKKYQDKYVIDEKGIPENVNVFRTPVWYLPFGIFYKWLGKLHYNSVKRVIKRESINFDLVHSHFIWSSGYVGMKLREEYKKPLLITAHGFDVYSLPFVSKDWGKRIKEVLSNADVIVTPTKKNARILRELDNSESVIKVIKNGYNSSIFYVKNLKECREILGIPTNKKVLVSVGNLEKLKGHEYLINAVKLLLEKQEDVLCYIIGGGTQYPKLRDLIKKLKLEEKVFLLGHLPHDKINNYLNSADLFVFPSLKESFGIAQIEALSCGKPLVSTKTEGGREVLISEEYGYLCNVADPEDLAIKIDMALKKNWNKDEIIKYAKTFGQSSINENLLNLYKSLLERND